MFWGIFRNVVMVLQTHNSKLTIKLLQDFQNGFKIHKSINQTSTKLTLRLIKSWYNKWVKFKVYFTSQRTIIFNSTTTPQILDNPSPHWLWISGGQVGGKERKQDSTYFTIQSLAIYICAGYINSTKTPKSLIDPPVPYIGFYHVSTSSLGCNLY